MSQLKNLNKNILIYLSDFMDYITNHQLTYLNKRTYSILSFKKNIHLLRDLKELSLPKEPGKVFEVAIQYYTCLYSHLPLNVLENTLVAYFVSVLKQPDRHICITSVISHANIRKLLFSNLFLLKYMREKSGVSSTQDDLAFLQFLSNHWSFMKNKSEKSM